MTPSSPPLRRHLGAALLVLVLSALLAASASASSRVASGAKGGATTSLLVKFNANASAAARAAALTGAGAADVRTIGDIGVHVLRVPADHAAAALTRLKGNSTVSFAELDATLQPQESLPNDPYFPQQYALGGGAWGWYQTHTTQAWDITQGSPSVVVAGLDTGLKTSGLSDFSGQLVGGWNVLSNSSDTSSQAGNHGTYLAAVVGRAGGNGPRNAGFCPGDKIMPVQVVTDSRASYTTHA